jgi:hypothetical protein
MDKAAKGKKVKGDGSVKIVFVNRVFLPLERRLPAFENSRNVEMKSYFASATQYSGRTDHSGRSIATLRSNRPR